MSPRRDPAAETSMTGSGGAGAGEAAETAGAATATLMKRGYSLRDATNERTRSRSDQAHLVELGFHDVLVERLHDVFVGPGVERARDVHHVVLGGAEHHLGRVAARQPAQRLEELVAVHHRHVPIEQHRVGQLALALRQRLLAALGLGDPKIQPFEDAPPHLGAPRVPRALSVAWSREIAPSRKAPPARGGGPALRAAMPRRRRKSTAVTIR